MQRRKWRWVARMSKTKGTRKNNRMDALESKKESRKRHKYDGRKKTNDTSTRVTNGGETSEWHIFVMGYKSLFKKKES